MNVLELDTVRFSADGAALEIPDQTKLPGRVEILRLNRQEDIHEAIREDAHVLYGFVDKRERELFELLISISGVGGQTARTILSAYSPAELASIISNEQANMLKSVKGIGPKAAQRIIVELKDKISLDMTVGGQQTTATTQQAADNEVVKEDVAALTMLGFSPAPTQKVVLQLVKDTPSLTVEQIIKQALKML